MLSCLMITLKNKHKTEDVPRDLGKALHCTWEEMVLRFSGALAASGYQLCCLFSRRDELGGMWWLGEKIQGERGGGGGGAGQKHGVQQELKVTDLFPGNTAELLSSIMLPVV